MRITRLELDNIRSFCRAELDFNAITLLVGKNNAGKSTLVSALHCLQRSGPEMDRRDIRIGETEGRIAINLEQIESRHFPLLSVGEARRTRERDKGLWVSRLAIESSHSDQLEFSDGSKFRTRAIQAAEPNNFIYSYLSKRKVVSYDEDVRLDRAQAVEADLRNLAARVDTVANADHPASQEYARLCESLIGFRVSAVASTNGKLPGIPVGNHGRIYVEDMGDGVANILGLITDLCMAQKNLFLIEEPENDIHPQGLKKLLQLIVEKSATNQFVVSTHSNIVTKYLGAADLSRIYAIEMERDDAGIPTSHVEEVENTPHARIELLRDLGYELSDSDLWEGWLILEESSAEAIIREFLIPWFAPSLTRVRTLSAGGVSKVAPTFDDFRRLFLFAHLEPQYRTRAWIVVDGDEVGKKAVRQLKGEYKNWPSDAFRALARPNFEDYYPECFQPKVQEVLSIRSRREKAGAKRALIEEVKDWCRRNPEVAKEQLMKSADEVIGVLREIETSLLSAGSR